MRYQAAWERTAHRWLFITHNDVLYQADVVSAMLQQAQGHIAVGPVGQCWNCPGHFAGRCGPDRFMDYRPGPGEWADLQRTHPGPRQRHYPVPISATPPWPLPECRVNEWAMLVDMERARPITMPYGPIVPLGAFHGLDIGTEWFGRVMRMGYTVKHFELEGFARHAWASRSGNGHEADGDPEEYARTEESARRHWMQHYG